MDPISLLLVIDRPGRRRGARLAVRPARAKAARRGADAPELLRLTLDEVTKERDAERWRAPTRPRRTSPTLQADARNFEARMKELLEAKEALTAQFHEVGAKLLERGAEAVPRARRRPLQPGQREERRATEGAAPAGRGDAEALRGRAQQGREGEGGQLRGAARGGAPCSMPATRQVRDETAQAGQRAPPQPQVARPLGRAEPEERARAGRALALCRFSVRGFGRHRGRPPAPRRDRSPAGRPQADHRRQMLAQRLSRRQRRGRRGRSRPRI